MLNDDNAMFTLEKLLKDALGAERVQLRIVEEDDGEDSFVIDNVEVTGLSGDKTLVITLK